MLVAMIFDFDGLMVDTESPVLESWREVYAGYGVDLPLDEWLKCVGSEYGPHTFDPVTYLEARTTREIDWPYVEGMRSVREVAITDKQPALPGVESLLDDAQTHGVRLAVGSSSPHSWVDHQLKRLGLFDRFEVIICADDVERVKPAPDLFIKAAGTLGVDPARAVVLEDSPHGVVAARQAGIFPVAVPNTLTRHLRFEGVGLQVESMAELSVARLRAALEAEAGGS